MLFMSWKKSLRLHVGEKKNNTDRPQNPNKMYFDFIEEGDKEAKGTVIIDYSTTTAIGDEKSICLKEIPMESFKSLQIN